MRQAFGRLQPPRYRADAAAASAAAPAGEAAAAITTAAAAATTAATATAAATAAGARRGFGTLASISSAHQYAQTYDAAFLPKRLRKIKVNPKP